MDPHEIKHVDAIVVRHHEEQGWNEFLGLGNTGFGQWFNKVTGITKHQEQKQIDQLDANPTYLATPGMQPLPTQPLDTSYEGINAGRGTATAQRLAQESGAGSFLNGLLTGLGNATQNNYSPQLPNPGSPANSVADTNYLSSGNTGSTPPHKANGYAIALYVLGPIVLIGIAYGVYMEVKKRKKK